MEAIERTTKEGDKHVILMDEGLITNNHYNIQPLIDKLKQSDVDLNMAMNPIGTNCDPPYNLLFEKSDCVFVERLNFKHRNSWEINMLLLHLKHFMLQKDLELISSKLSLTDDEDEPLEQSSLHYGLLPLWIVADENESEEAILKGIIDENLIFLEDQDVVVLYNEHRLRSENIRNITHFCERNNWKCLSRTDMTGSEASIIILMDIANADLEDYSRGRDQLIVVTR